MGSTLALLRYRVDSRLTSPPERALQQSAQTEQLPRQPEHLVQQECP